MEIAVFLPKLWVLLRRRTVDQSDMEFRLDSVRLLELSEEPSLGRRDRCESAFEGLEDLGIGQVYRNIF